MKHFCKKVYFFVTPKIAIRGHKHSIRKWLYFAVEIPFKVCYNSLTRKKALLQEGTHSCKNALFL